MNREEFRGRIRTSLANPTLQTALDFNAEHRVQARINALASLPNWRDKRQQAHAIRAQVIDHLDEYLEQFIRKVGENGIIVHRATDGGEAIGVILKIINSSRQKRKEEKRDEVLIAKSKSMVTEEINLNPALEAQGMRVVETDLGEYIVQLRGEKPSHIITPAVHLRRNDVAQLFHDKLGIPYTEDITVLTNTARAVLREVFLTADVGISGVNAGVAETGTICVVSNEGNARMVTTLPPVHIALMGMERLVRTLDDLGVILSLLARSATGQKLSVYTQLVHSPFEGQQRHLILLDNGRSRLRNSPLRESLYCIRCGACLNACPVFREIGGHAYLSPYSGPIGSVISAGLFGSDFAPLAQASSLCGACKDACPVDIDLPKLLTRVRAGMSEVKDERGKEAGGLSKLGTFFMKSYSQVARRPRLFTLSQKFAALGTRLVSPFGDYVHLPALTGWGYSKDLPRFAGKTFRERFDDRKEREKEERNEYIGTQGNTPVENATSVSRGSDELKTQFVEELTKVSGNVIHTSPVELTNKIIELLISRQVDRIDLQPGLLDEVMLQKAGIAISREPDPTIRVGVTKTICGLADTGSILVADGEGDPLQASLLPEIHIAVLCRSDILPSLTEALTLPIVRDSRSAVFITGPSRTGDIEFSLTIGVHGPGEVHVFLVDD